MLPENLIHPAIVDFLIFGCGPWDDDLMAPLGPLDPPWHGSVRISLAAENAILRHHPAVLQRGRSGPLLRPADRVPWIWLCRHWNRWHHALVLIQPATVLRWHREGYRHYRRAA